MATKRFNRQFILLDFEDLDNPEFMAFVRSPAFSTYLIMRRYIWRSDKPHSLGLHEYYANGSLACALSREKIGECLGQVSGRTVTKDINELIDRGVIKSVFTGRGNVYMLGKWAVDQEDKVYYEYFFLDRLHTSLEENVQAAWNPKPGEGGRNLPGSLEENFPSEWKKPSTNNREWNSRKNKENKEDSNSSKVPRTSSSTSSELSSSLVEMVIDTSSTDFQDMEHLESNISRAYNLWERTSLDEEEFVEKLYEARDVTQDRIARSAVQDRTKKMAYFFAVLEDLLGLRKK